MSTGKKWLRPTEKTKQFPTNKYHFSQHLTQVGDWIETDPVTRSDVKKLNKAAHFWAWQHKCRVSVVYYPAPDDMCVVRITLVSKHRYRDYD